MSAFVTSASSSRLGDNGSGKPRMEFGNFNGTASGDSAIQFITEAVVPSSQPVGEIKFSSKTRDDSGFGADAPIHLSGVATPSLADHAVNKGYVDGLVSGLDIKPSTAVLTQLSINRDVLTSHYSGVRAQLVADGKSQYTDAEIDDITGITLNQEEVTAGRLYDFFSAPAAGGNVVTRTGRGVSDLDQANWGLSNDINEPFRYNVGPRIMVEPIVTVDVNGAEVLDRDNFKLHKSYRDLVHVLNGEEEDNFSLTLGVGSRIVLAGQGAAHLSAGSLTSDHTNGVWEVTTPGANPGSTIYDDGITSPSLPASSSSVVHKQAIKTSADTKGEFTLTTAEQAIFTNEKHVFFVVLKRVDDMQTGSSVPGAFAFVEDGTYSGEGFVVNSGGDNIDSADPTAVDQLTFTQFSGAGNITAGKNLDKTAGTIRMLDTVTELTSVSSVAFQNETKPRQAKSNSTSALSTLPVGDPDIRLFDMTADTMHIGGIHGQAAGLNDQTRAQSTGNDGFHIDLKTGDTNMRNSVLTIAKLSENVDSAEMTSARLAKDAGKLIMDGAPIILQDTGNMQAMDVSGSNKTLEIDRSHVSTASLLINSNANAATSRIAAYTAAGGASAEMHFALDAGDEAAVDSSLGGSAGTHINQTGRIHMNNTPLKLNNDDTSTDNGITIDGVGTSNITMALGNTGGLLLKGAQDIVMNMGNLELKSDDASNDLGGKIRTEGATSKIEVCSRNCNPGAEEFVVDPNGAQTLTLRGQGSIVGVQGTFSGYLQAAEFFATSDKKLKQNIVYTSSSDDLAKVLSIQPATYQFISAPDRQRSGVIAQDLQAVAPELVDTVHKGTEKEHLAVNYIDLVSTLVGAVHALQSQLKSLQLQLA